MQIDNRVNFISALAALIHAHTKQGHRFRRINKPWNERESNAGFVGQMSQVSPDKCAQTHSNVNVCADAIEHQNKPIKKMKMCFNMNSV
jgi:hypothetical protein